MGTDDLSSIRGCPASEIEYTVNSITCRFVQILCSAFVSVFSSSCKDDDVS